MTHNMAIAFFLLPPWVGYLLWVFDGLINREQYEDAYDRSWGMLTMSEARESRARREAESGRETSE